MNICSLRTKHWNSALDEEGNGLKNAFCGFDFYCLAASLLHDPDRRIVGLHGASLVAPER